MPITEFSAVLRALRISEWARKANPLLFVCAFVMVASLLLGGGTRAGFLSDAILQLIAIPLVLFALWRIAEIKLTRQARLALWVCAAIVALPLIQLIPLPPWLWTRLPNREVSVEAYTILGHSVPWMPISVSPQATWPSLLSLLPPLSIFIATLQLGYSDRRSLSVVILTVGVLSAFIGLLQVAQGQESSLRFFQFTNSTEAVGFFANRNHFAALIYCLMLLTIGWIVYGVAALQSQLTQQPAGSRYDIPAIFGLLVSVTALVILLAGEFMARSRAGLGLTMLALLGIAALGYSDRQSGFGAPLTKVLIGVVVLVLTFSLQFALYRVLERVPDTLQDDRPVIARTTIEAAKAYAPIGSGVGTFVPSYAMFEKPENVSDTYVNHAHNDLLELLLETGVLGLSVLGLFVTLLVRRSIDIWRARPIGASDLDWSLARSATMVPTLLLIHSFFDYPLRTAAMMSVMAFACSLLIEPPVGLEPKKDELHALREQLRQRQSRVLVPSSALPTTLAPPSAPTKGFEQWGKDVEWPREWSQSTNTTPPHTPNKNK